MHPLSRPSSFPASGSFLMSQFLAWSGQSIGTSASASILPLSIQGWFPLGLTGLISLLLKGLSRVFSSATVQKHQFFSAQPSSWSNSCLRSSSLIWKGPGIWPRQVCASVFRAEAWECYRNAFSSKSPSGKSLRQQNPVLLIFSRDILMVQYWISRNSRVFVLLFKFFMRLWGRGSLKSSFFSFSFIHSLKIKILISSSTLKA